MPGQAVGSLANQSRSTMQPEPIKLDQASPKLPLQSSTVTTSGTEAGRSGTCELEIKESDKNKTSLPIKKKGQSDSSSAKTGSSLANLWGRASSKSKSINSPAEDKSAALKTNGECQFQKYFLCYNALCLPNALPDVLNEFRFVEPVDIDNVFRSISQKCIVIF